MTTTKMLKLPQITLIALTGKDFESHDYAIKKSCEGIEWGAVKIIYDYTIKNINDWNYKIVYELGNYVDTDFCMLIHADGYVINPDAFKPEFLEYDFIGAPWPLPRDSYSYRTPEGEIIRVGNSVSIRSKSLLDAPRRLGLPWRPYYGNTNEDGYLNVHQRSNLIAHGLNFAPLDIAKYFSKEHEIEENKEIKTFAFHQVDL